VGKRKTAEVSDAIKKFGTLRRMRKGVLRDAKRIGKVKPLDLDIFRVENITRCVAPNGFNHPLEEWSTAEWMNALAGEAGEACNVAKKILRVDKKLRGSVKKGDKSRERLVAKLANEVADVVIYADLVLAREGVSLAASVVRVWNKKSKQIGYDRKL
jgi:NTP pyrophosphatase (non-canonical NTP hydrolase)